ncbi:hypothetical protein AMJ40_01190 [candidate division TA06 bacterium DG_26]|uniref:Uncharacterized protein n=1 Tax=candidate division TA06 bacterium DG_26 TaxID=1703771 RepID=A0A0S7WLJ1_UNCT6|nr:MAG: hypothetical protein AMJ40_01190 [candidate division TA06 bacterium DG_26]
MRNIDCLEVRKLGILIVLACAFSGTLVHPQDTEIIKREAELSRIRESLHECRRRKNEIEEEKQSTLARLEVLSEELELTEDLIDAVKREESSLKTDVGALKKRVERMEERLKTRRLVLGGRLRELYKRGKAHDLELLLFSKSFSDAVKKIKYVMVIAEQDKRLIDSTGVLIRSLVEERERLSQKMEKERKLREEKESEKKNMEKDRRTKEEILDRLKDEREEKEKLEKELEEAERRVTELIESLERERLKGGQRFEGTGLSERKGKLQWPVEGEVSSGFGKKTHPVYKTVTQNNGIDIEAEYGAPVHSVARGKVVYAGRFLGYGQVVLLDHGEGYYTLYAHLSQITAPPGSVVDENIIIGYVGSSLDGSLLHFEVRQKGKPEDPLVWLKSR